jgi:hypothetical protein
VDGLRLQTRPEREEARRAGRSDPRGQHFLGDRGGSCRPGGRVASAAASWPVDPGVPDEVKTILSVARELFVHSYFVYEFSVVAVWVEDLPCSTLLCPRSR